VNQEAKMRSLTCLLVYLIIVLLFFFETIPVAAEIPQMISYQGKVTDAGGNPVPDGTYTMRFRIYDAATGGNLEWDSGVQSITVNDGMFDALLGESPQPVINLPFDIDYWLLVTFAGTNQTPRQRIVSTGYAYMASGLVPETVITGTSPTTAVLEIKNQADNGIAIQASASGSTGPFGGNAIYATTNGTGPAVEAHAMSNVSGAVGIYGKSTGVGVMGVCTDVMGSGYGPDVGVHGEATTISSGGTSYGVYGKGQTHGGYFYGQYVGVYGKSFETDGGTGVVGTTQATTGDCWGVHGLIESPSGRGIYGHAQATTGSGYGVYGETASTAGRGVYGRASATTGVNYGVRGYTASPSGYAGYFVGRSYFSDRVGIGTSSPDCALEVRGTGSNWTEGFLMLKNTGEDAGIRLYDSDTGVKHHIFNDDAGSDRLRIAPEGAYSSGITVLQNGNVGVNTLSPNTKLAVYGLSGTSSYSDVKVNTTTGSLYYYSSSRRYKDDIRPLEDDFEKILYAEPKSFIDIESGERNIGFIAEEFEDLGLEHLVIYREGVPDGLKYELVSMYLLELMKELRTENDELRSRVEVLEKK